MAEHLQNVSDFKTEWFWRQISKIKQQSLQGVRIVVSKIKNTSRAEEAVHHRHHFEPKKQHLQNSEDRIWLGKSHQDF